MAAQMRVQDAGTLRTIRQGWVMQAGVLRRLRTIKVMDDGVLQTVAIFGTPLSVSAPSAIGSFNGSGVFPPQLLTTDLATAAPSGGFGPYSYAWTHLSGSTFTVTHPTSAGTYFSHNFTAFGSRSGTYRCTVTDSQGSTATVDVAVQIDFSF